MKILFVGLFGLVGIYGRWALGSAFARWFPGTFPSGTFFINILGSFIIAVVYVVSVERMHLSEDLRIGIMIGLLGGFTTFSSFSLEAARLLEQSNYFYSLLYLGLSPILGLLAALAGLAFSRHLFGGI